MIYSLPNSYLRQQNSCKTPVSDLVGKKRPDVVKELQLLLEGVTTLLGNIHDIKNGRSQVSQSCNRLHLDGVPLLQRVVQDTGGVHHLCAHSINIRKMRMTG